MQVLRIPILVVLTLAIVGCASIPSAPSVLALPGTGKTFEQFRVDDANCRYYAYVQTGGDSAQRDVAAGGVASAAVGTALGAAAGAAMGGGRGAAVGAGLGLVGGGLTGIGSVSDSSLGRQEQYDNAYVQCMYAQGHRVPVWGKFAETASGLAGPPPPPPGNPPAPPPDVLNPVSR